MIDLATLNAAELLVIEAAVAEARLSLRYAPARKPKPRRMGTFPAYAHDLWLLDTVTWEQRREETALGYATEMAEFELDNPRPQFKHYLTGLAREQEAS